MHVHRRYHESIAFREILDGTLVSAFVNPANGTYLANWEKWPQLSAVWIRCVLNSLISHRNVFNSSIGLHGCVCYSHYDEYSGMKTHYPLACNKNDYFVYVQKILLVLQFAFCRTLKYTYTMNTSVVLWTI